MVQTRLTRSTSDKMVAGVCGGLAQYLDIDPVLVRMAFAALGLASGVGLLFYIVLWIVTPTDIELEDIGDYTVVDDPGSFKSDEQRERSNSRFFAGLLIVIGVWFMLANFGIRLEFLWPIGLIGLGVYLIARRRR